MPQHPSKRDERRKPLSCTAVFELTGLFLYQEQKYLLSLLENKQSCSVHGPFLSLVLLGLAYPRFRCRMKLFGSCVVTMTHLHVPSVLLDGVEDRSWLGR